MMKKIISIVFILLIFLSYFLVPIKSTAKTNTFNDLKKELEKLKEEKSNQKQLQETTEEELREKNNIIYNINIDIENIAAEIDSIQSEIEKLNNEINILEEETENILKFLQTFNKEKAYLEYFTSSSNITEMIMRYNALEQVIDYNIGQLKKLNKLVLENNKSKEKLEEKQKNSNNKKQEYQKNIKNLGKYIKNFAEVTETIDTEIKILEDLIEFYSEIGCKNNESLDNCIKISATNTWLKPLNKGKITSAFGYRNHPISGNYELHNGIDIGGNIESTPVYSSTIGIVIAISYSDCGGRKIYIRSIVDNKKYTIYYYHLWDIYVKVGDIVNTDTIIASVGGGEFSKIDYPDRCSTGAHLHFGVAEGWYLSDYYDYSALLAKNINPPGYPKYGGWFYNREQYFY